MLARHWRTNGFVVAAFFSGLSVRSMADVDQNPETIVPAHRYELVEPFTAFTLARGEARLGLVNFDYAPLDKGMLGTDFLATAIGAPNLKLKAQVFRGEENIFALGMRAAYLNRDTILWGSVKDHFVSLEAQTVTPSVSWTKVLSGRLNLHSHWGMSFGRIKAELTPKGKRRLWESKHPNGDYDAKKSIAEDATSGNQEKSTSDSPASLKQRTLLLSSLAGMATNTFQITGEFTRDTGQKILLSSRIERVKVERLKASVFRFTAAQQWIWRHFQFRLGIGAQYQVLTGVDLDGEEIDEAGVVPASDIDFYWRF